MTMKLAYWVFAYFLTIAAVAVALNGISHVKKGDIQTHLKRMVFSNNLILFFVVTYVFKMTFLGREDKSQWSTLYLVILYVHEAFIGFMLISGVYARVMARRFKSSLEASDIPEQHQIWRQKHKTAGKLTLLFAILAIITATGVLHGMFSRAGLI